MFWLFVNKGVVAGGLLDDNEVGWRISSKKLAEITKTFVIHYQIS